MVNIIEIKIVIRILDSFKFFDIKNIFLKNV